MRAERKRRLTLTIMIALGASAVLALILNAFNQNMVFFLSPTQIVNQEAPDDRFFRLGGLVENGSLVREEDGLTVRFRITDLKSTIQVRYTGILPDLFREGQGVIGFGRLQEDNVFVADEILAKHDENYMPPEVAEALEKNRPAKANSI